MHHYERPEYVLDKDAINNPEMFCEQQKMAALRAGMHDTETRKHYKRMNSNTVFRSPASIVGLWEVESVDLFDESTDSSDFTELEGIFSPRKVSRFNFDFDLQGEEEIEVPKEVQSFLSNAVTKLSFFKALPKDCCKKRLSAEVNGWLSYSPDRTDADLFSGLL